MPICADSGHSGTTTGLPEGTLVVEEADAIGTAALRAQLLPEPFDSRITHLMADYSDARLKYFGAGNDNKTITAALEQTTQLQKQIWDITRDVARAAPTPITSTSSWKAVNLSFISPNSYVSVENDRILILIGGR